jgi:hypothetical protein
MFVRIYWCKQAADFSLLSVRQMTCANYTDLRHLEPVKDINVNSNPALTDYLSPLASLKRNSLYSSIAD